MSEEKLLPSTTLKKSSLILLALCAFLLFDFTQLNMMGAISPFLVSMLSISKAQLGLISSLFFYVNLALLIPAAILLDKYEPKLFVILSIICTIIGIKIFLIHETIENAILWRSLSGVAGAFSYISCIKIIATYFPKRWKGFLIGSTGIVIMLAGVIAQYPFTKLIEKHGIHFALTSDIYLGLFVILILLFIPKSKNKNAPENQVNNYSPYKKTINWFIALYASLTNFPLFVLGALWGNLFLHNAHNISLSNAAIATSLIFTGNMIGAPILGAISDRIKNKRILMVLSASLYLLSMASIALYHGNQLVILDMLFFILGISTGSQTLAYAMVVDCNTQPNVARATSLLSLFSVGGGAAAQPFFGWLVNNGNYNNGLYFLIACATASIFIAHYMLKKL